MENVKDYLEKLELFNTTFQKQFKDVNIQKIVYFKENKLLHMYLSSKNIVQYENLNKLRAGLKEKLNYFEDIKIKMRYTNLDKYSAKDIIKQYWSNILFVLKYLSPSISCVSKDIEFLCIENNLKIKIPDEMFYKRLMAQNAIYSLKTIINEELGLDLNISFEIAVNKKADIKALMDKSDAMTQTILESKFADNEPSIKTDEEYVIKEIVEDNDIIYGKDLNFPIEKIEKLNSDSGTVCIVGEVFEVEAKELKNGKVLLIASLTDYTSSINCKLFLNDRNRDNVLSQVTKGSYLKIKGDVLHDNYSKELTMTISGIKKETRVEKMDNYEEKRVELHAHTQMSSMDAICSAKKLVERAAKWGHKAVAITDHGIVQAFPEAMDAGKKFGIKVLYGVEGYFADNEASIIKNANSLPLSQTFVVFDIETTGFSNKNDRITEIGAVKIENFKIVDRFSELINPEIDIPYKIQELTGITNDLVKDKPNIEEVLPKFMEFVGDSTLVAHNSDFDTGFIREKCSQMDIEYTNEAIDTLSLARILLPKLKRYKLNNIAKELGIPLLNHHRAVDDAEATAQIFIKFLEILQKQGAINLDDINKIYEEIDYTKLNTKHMTILVKNYVGLKNLYKLISNSHINHFYRNPRILKSVLKEHREGLIIGSACEAGEIFEAVTRNVSKDELEEIVNFYDYIEIMPIDNNRFMIEKGEVKDEEELRDINRKLVEIAKEYNKLVVATGDVHYLDPHDDIYRKILKNGQGFNVKDEEGRLYFRTTDEMIKEFSYLGEELAKEVVITNPNKIADMVENIKPIPDETYAPIIEGSDEELRSMCYEKAKRIYGDPMPEVVQKRLDRELNSIISNGYAVMYIIAQKLVTKSLRDGYLVGSRGSVGSSFAATMSDITEVNPLPAHYVCPNEDCKYSYFYEVGEWGSGADLPDKDCPNCNTKLIKDGHDIPFEVFLGFEGDKEPDIDLNFAGEYQAVAHKYTEELFGEGYVFKAGTIGTIAEKTAYGYAKKYVEENNIVTTSAEVLRLAGGCTGIKRTSGQHPGGVMVCPHYKDIYDFTPIQYPANDSSSGVITTHFDYHSISGRILKLDILGHDVPTIIRMLDDMTGIDATKIPLDDKETMSLFTSTEALGITPDEINSPIGSLAIPEFGTKFVRQMLIDTKPTTFAELVRISGLSHGTDVWLNNAQDLVREGIVGLKDVISTRDDIMNYLIFKGLPPKMSFKIMENVRKGKGLTSEHIEEMKKNDVPDWYINSCQTIKYMFPKAHAVAYVMMSFRIAYFKVHYPAEFYATYFTTKSEDFDADLVVKGIDTVKKKKNELEQLGSDATAKEKNMLTVLEVVVEMFARKIEVMPVDLFKSDAKKFKVVDGKLLPPLVALQGVGENAAINIVRERERGEFLSKEDLRTRTKVSKTVIETLSNHGALENMSESNQLSLI